MISRRAAFLILAVLAGFAILQNLYYWLHLPDRVAIHFNGRGEPDDWATRDNATMIMLGLQLVFPALMMTVAPVASRLPNSLINVPHREYWLAPERRDFTLQEMSKFMSIVAISSACLFVGINHLTYVANRDQTPLPILPFLCLLIGFLGIIFGYTGRFVWRFSRVPKEPA